MTRLTISLNNIKTAFSNKCQKVWFLVFLTLTIFIFGSCASSQKAVSQFDTLRYDYFFHEAVKQASEQNYAESFELMQYCIDADSSSAAAKYQLAMYYMLLNDKTMPEKLLLEAVSQEPDNYWYHRLLGTQYKNNHQPYLAIKEYEEMSRRFPQRSDVLLELAEIYDEIGQYQKELHVIKRYGLLEDVYDQLSYQRFLCYLQMEKYDSAYYEIAPSAPEAMEALMKSVNNRAGLDILMRFCSVVEKKDPSVWQTYKYLALSYFQIKNEDEAFVIINRGLKNTSDSLGLSSLYSLRGEFYNDKDRRDLTYQDYDSALAFNPKDISILNNYAYFLSLENRDLNRALKMSRTVIESESDNPTYLDTYAWILFKLGQYNEALTYILQAINNGGNVYPEVVEHCGDIYFNCGNKEKALEYWHAAVRLNSESKSIEQKILQEKYIE